MILGRFTSSRKEVLDILREELRARGYLPVLFDFDRPNTRDVNETISILAHISRFVIADITDARSVPQELSHIIPNLPSVPIQPILQIGSQKYGMFEHFERYPWVLKIFQYQDTQTIINCFNEKILEPVKTWRKGIS